MNYIFEEIEEVKEIGLFEDEYVYDIEVDDENHTFIVNDILVHNSNYISFEEVFNTIESIDTYDNLKKIDLIKQIYKFRLKDYIVDKLNKYAKLWNTENLHDFELELISYSGIWLAKKKYMLNVAWTDKDIVYKPVEKIKSTGVEIIQTSSSLFIRNKLLNIVEYIFKHGNDVDVSKITVSLKKLKKQIELMNIEEVSLSKKISDYDKYVVNDKSKIELLPKCPIHVRAAAIHNWMVNSDAKYKRKYDLIKSGDKIKYMYTKNKSAALNVLGYTPGNLPVEFLEHFPVDYDMQFEKLILGPINRILSSMGKPEINRTLITIKGLFK